MVEFLLNGLVFILIGLQVATIVRSLAGQSLLALLGLGLALSATLIGVRLIWIFLEVYLPRGVARLWRGHGSSPRDRAAVAAAPQFGWQKVFVVGWAGMRGVVSLAAALALPQATPARDVLIFLTFFVILATLVGQGLSLPWLIRRLGVIGDGSALAHQELHARQAATEAARTRIAQLEEEWPTHLPLIETLRVQYDHRAGHFAHTHADPSDASPPGGHLVEDEADEELIAHHRIRRAVLAAERTAVLDLRERGEIADEVWRQIEWDLDLEEMRMDA
jgi:CPA1 family monovalent cation:H+ antiporter